MKVGKKIIVTDFTRELAEGLGAVKEKVTNRDVYRCAMVSNKGGHTIQRYISGDVREIRDEAFAVRVLKYLGDCAMVNNRGDEEKAKLIF